MGGLIDEVNIQVYMKDFLENIPESYQSKMITELTNDPTRLNTIAAYLVNNTIAPKEFHVISDQATTPSYGIQDQITAYINNIYYINSSNDYTPYTSNNLYGST